MQDAWQMSSPPEDDSQYVERLEHRITTVHSLCVENIHIMVIPSMRIYEPYDVADGPCQEGREKEVCHPAE